MHVDDGSDTRVDGDYLVTKRCVCNPATVEVLKIAYRDFELAEIINGMARYHAATGVGGLESGCCFFVGGDVGVLICHAVRAIRGRTAIVPGIADDEIPRRRVIAYDGVGMRNTLSEASSSLCVEEL